jgi:hypothetical protein
VAARAIAVHQDTDPADIEKRLQTESSAQSLVSYTWTSTDATVSYRVVVNKPYWLLRTAVSGDAVVWVPKQIVKTDCSNAQRTPMKIPFPH